MQKLAALSVLIVIGWSAMLILAQVGSMARDVFWIAAALGLLGFVWYVYEKNKKVI